MMHDPTPFRSMAENEGHDPPRSHVRAGSVSFLEIKEIAVRPRSREDEDERVFLFPIDEQPVRFNMAFLVSYIIPRQFMVATLFRKSFPIRKNIDDRIKLSDATTSLMYSFEIFSISLRFHDTIERRIMRHSPFREYQHAFLQLLHNSFHSLKLPALPFPTPS